MQYVKDSVSSLLLTSYVKLAFGGISMFIVASMTLFRRLALTWMRQEPQERTKQRWLDTFYEGMKDTGIHPDKASEVVSLQKEQRSALLTGATKAKRGEEALLNVHVFMFRRDFCWLSLNKRCGVDKRKSRRNLDMRAGK